MLKFHEEHADKSNITAGCQPQTKRLKLRKKGMPKQQHIIPEVPVIPWENKQDKRENWLIGRLDECKNTAS